MSKKLIDEGGISKLLEISNGGQMRKIIRYYYIFNMAKEDIAEQLCLSKVVVEAYIASINTLIDKNLILRECKECGKHFYTSAPQTMFCEKCKIENKKAQGESSRQQYKKPTSSKKKIKEPKPLNQVIKEMVEYNKKHNTRYDYGYYVLQVEGYNGI